MPLPTPGDEESKSDFIDRCMGNEFAVEDFPDESQRRAVCESKWEEKAKESDAGEDTMGFMDMFTKSDEDDMDEVLKRRFSRDQLADMNNEELLSLFTGISARFTRMREAGAEILAEIQSREGSDDPEGLALFDAISGSEESKTVKKEDEEEENGPPSPAEKRAEVLKMADEVDNAVRGDGPVGARVAFVSASPSMQDTIRGEPLTGPAGRVFKDVYLEPFGLTRDDVFVTHVVPVMKTDSRGREVPPGEEEIEKWSEYLEAELGSHQVDYVVALGKTASDALGETADEFLPHPGAVYKKGDSGEVGRKMDRLMETLKEEDAERVYDTRILKASHERQEITGVVMEPDVEDTDGDWASEDEVMKAQRFFMMNSQTIKLQHQQETDDVRVVESWIERSDREIGDAMVKSGSWLMTVKVKNPKIWKAVKNQDFNGFSIGGYASHVSDQ